MEEEPKRLIPFFGPIALSEKINKSMNIQEH